jgi:uncharacterized SAM-binding protein YcdF (DUF218 family)
LRKFIPYLIFIISILIIFFIILYSSLSLYIAKQAEKDMPSKADAILVLGAKSYIDGKYNPCLEARVNHAMILYQSGYAHTIIVSGGNDREDDINEAETMKKIAMEKGIPSTAILEEKSATSTYENFSLSQKILKKNSIESVIIVTEPFHVARAALVAKKVGYNFSVSPVKDSICWAPNKYFTKYFLKEPFVIALYKLQNKL